MTIKNKNCHTAVPTVDNTEYKCDNCGFTDIECVKSDIAFLYLSAPANSNLKLILERIQTLLIQQSNRITALENA
jgi:hypothetical protein